MFSKKEVSLFHLRFCPTDNGMQEVCGPISSVQWSGLGAFGAVCDLLNSWPLQFRPRSLHQISRGFYRNALSHLAYYLYIECLDQIRDFPPDLLKFFIECVWNCQPCYLSHFKADTFTKLFKFLDHEFTKRLHSISPGSFICLIQVCNLTSLK